MESKAVFDAGPIIHLDEIGRLEILDFIEKKLITGEVSDEPGNETLERAEAESRSLEGEAKDQAKYLCNRHNLEMGEATTISLCLQEEIDLVFTDDLDARQAAKRHDLDPHGTLAIVTRAFAEDLISKKEAKQIIEELRKDSSLFLTADLVKWAKNRIEEN